MATPAPTFRYAGPSTPPAKGDQQTPRPLDNGLPEIEIEIEIEIAIAIAIAIDLSLEPARFAPPIC